MEIRLTPKELELLLFLAQHPGRVLTHRAILKAVWGPHAVDQPEHLRVLVASLRKKIEPDPSRPRYISTEPWVGYRFVGEPGARSRGTLEPRAASIVDAVPTLAGWDGITVLRTMSA